MFFDVLGSALGAQALGWVGRQQAADEIFGVFGDLGFFGEFEMAILDLGERFPLTAAMEGGLPVEHLVDENTQRPPIDSATMAGPVDHFGGQVIFSADEGIGHEAGLNRGRGVGVDRDAARLTQVKVSEHDVPAPVEQDVLGFEIAIDEVFGMQIFKGQQHLGGIKFGHDLRQSLFGLLLQCSEEFAPGTILHDKIDVLFCLEGVI